MKEVRRVKINLILGNSRNINFAGCTDGWFLMLEQFFNVLKVVYFLCSLSGNLLSKVVNVCKNTIHFIIFSHNFK